MREVPKIGSHGIKGDKKMDHLQKHELIREIGIKTNYSQADIRNVLDALNEVAIEQIKSGKAVKPIAGITLSLVDAPERKHYDINTGELQTVPPRKRLRVKTSRQLKEEVEVR